MFTAILNLSLYYLIYLWLLCVCFNFCLFSLSLSCRRDSFITHRAFCDALAEESAKSQPKPVDSQPKPDLDANPDGDSQSAAVKPNPEPSPPPLPSSPPAPSPPQSTGEVTTVLPIPSQGKVNLLVLLLLVVCCLFLSVIVLCFHLG